MAPNPQTAWRSSHHDLRSPGGSLTAVLLALAASLSWGVGDFIGGFKTRSLGTLRSALELVPDAPNGHAERADTLLQRFRGFLDDDFNTSGALSVAYDTAHEVNRLRAAGPEGAALHAALTEMIEYDGPFVLDVEVPYQEHVLPMIPAGGTVKDLIKA